MFAVVAGFSPLQLLASRAGLGLVPGLWLQQVRPLLALKQEYQSSVVQTLMLYIFSKAQRQSCQNDTESIY
jgi:hypothetical protein